MNCRTPLNRKLQPVRKSPSFLQFRSVHRRHVCNQQGFGCMRNASVPKKLLQQSHACVRAVRRASLRPLAHRKGRKKCGLGPVCPEFAQMQLLGTILNLQVPVVPWKRYCLVCPGRAMTFSDLETTLIRFPVMCVIRGSADLFCGSPLLLACRCPWRADVAIVNFFAGLLCKT